MPRRGAWLCFLALLAGLAAAVSTVWLAQRTHLPAPWLWGAAGCAIAVPIAWRQARVGSGLLAWDGALWRLKGLDGELRVAMDLGPVLLLRFTPAGVTGSRTWMSVSARSAGPAWHGLRAAVYFRRPDANAQLQKDSAPRT